VVLKPNNDGSTSKIIPNLPKIIDIACGDLHSLALDEEGCVWCWNDTDNPKQIPDLRNIIQIMCRTTNSFTLDNQDNLLAWSGVFTEELSSYLAINLILLVFNL
jgi:alpha-tubulin suppressor-like RCC1 family protein